MSYVTFWFTAFFLIVSSFCGAWEMSYSRQYGDLPRELLPLNDGGYILAGGTEMELNGDYNSWIVRISSTGAIQWQKSFGFGMALSIAPAKGGFMLGFGSIQGNVNVALVNLSGNVEWARNYYVPNVALHRIRRSRSGEYLILGGSSHFNSSDAWAMKIDDQGKVKWQYTYGGPYLDYAADAQETLDSGWILAGAAQFSPNGHLRTWIVKLGSNGKIEWQWAFSGKDELGATNIQSTADGGYAIAGRDHKYRLFILQLASDGSMKWVKSYDHYNGGNGSFLINEKGGFLFVGLIGQVINNVISSAVSILSFDSQGQFIKERFFIPENSIGSSSAFAKMTSDGRVAVFGTVSRSLGSFQDWWFVLLNSAGNIGASCALQKSIQVASVPIQFKRILTHRKPLLHKALRVRNLNLQAITMDGTSRSSCTP